MKRMLLTIVMIFGLMVNPVAHAADVPEASKVVKDLTGIGHNLLEIGSGLCSLTVTLGKYTLWGTNKTLSFINYHPWISLGVALGVYGAWKKHQRKSYVIAGRMTPVAPGIVIVEDYTN